MRRWWPLAGRWWPLAAVVALLILAAVTASYSSLQVTRVTPPVDVAPTMAEYPPAAGDAPEAGDSPPPREIGDADRGEIPGWLTTLATALCLLAAVGVLGVAFYLLLRDALRRRSGRLPAKRRRSPAGTAEEVVAALDAGLVDLSDTDADPRRAVIACWVRLEQAAAAAGVPAQVGDTPTDLVTRLLSGGRPVSADVLSAFAEVYREARYAASHTVDERMRSQARDALRRLRTELTAGAGAGSGVGAGAETGSGSGAGAGAGDR